MTNIIIFPTRKAMAVPALQTGRRCTIFQFPVRLKAKIVAMPARDKAQAAREKRLRSKVKIAQKQLCICDEDYRLLLQANFGVSSCTELEERTLVQLVAYFRSKGWKDKPAARNAADRHGKPKNILDVFHPAAPVLRRIEALLSELGKVRGKYVPWSYAAAILRKNTGLDHLDMATAGEAQKVMIALENTVNFARRKPQ